MVNKLSEAFDTVIASLKYLDLRPNIREYRWRFLIQKITFLTQVLSSKTDYNFIMYVAGPYSPALAKDYYSQEAALVSLHTDYELTQDDIQHLEKIQECCDFLGELSLLEATSTMVHLMRGLSTFSDDDVFSNAKIYKPYLSDSTLVIGMTKAKKLLFKEEYLTEELKEEMDLWDKIQ